MAEKIDIFTLDIDVDAAIQSQSELKTRLDATKIGLESLKKQGDTTSQAFVEQEAKVKNLNREYNAARTQLGKLINIQGQEIKTIEQGRNALTIINKEWAKQAQLFGTNSKEADALAKKHLELKTRVNELQKGIGDTSGNIGNYAADIVDAAGKTTLFGRATSFVNSILGVAKPLYNAIKAEIIGIGTSYKAAMASTQGYSTAQKLAAVGTNVMSAALKIFKLALISTGIGALLVGLGSLVAFFSKTQRGADFVSKALAVLGAAFDVVIDRVTQFGEGLFRILSGDFTGGLDSITKSFKGIGDEIQREVSLAAELETRLQKLRDREIDLITVQAARKNQIEQLRLAAKDESTSLQERAKLLQQAGDLEKAVLDDQLAIAKERAAISQQETDRAESTSEDLKANAELQANVIELETESLKLQRSIEAEKQGLLKRARAEAEADAKERIAQAKKATDAAIKESKTKLDLFIAENEGKADSLKEQLSFEESIRDKKLKLVEDEVAAGLKTATEAELAKLQIKQSFLDIQKDLTVDFANEELQVYLSANKSRLDADQLLTDALVAEEVQRLQGIKDREAEFQAERLAQGEINQREYNDLIVSIDGEYKTAKDALEAEQKEQKAQATIIDEENRRATQTAAFDYDLSAQLAVLESKRQQELAIAEQTGADTALIEEKYADLQVQTKRSVRDAKISLAGDAFENFATILGKESKAGKAAAIAQTTITTYQSATNAFNSLSVIPIVGTVLGALAAAAAVASGIANVRKIASTPTPTVKAEKGMLMGIGGQRHSGGGTNFYGDDGTEFQAEKGELIGVMNRRAAQAFMGFNNQFVDGNTVTPNYFAQGGFVNRNLAPSTVNVTTSSSIDYALLTESIRQLPAPVTDVKDVIGQVNSYNRIVQGANI